MAMGEIKGKIKNKKKCCHLSSTQNGLSHQRVSFPILAVNICSILHFCCNADLKETAVTCPTSNPLALFGNMPVDSAEEGYVNTEIIIIVFVMLCCNFFFPGKFQYLLRLMVSDHCLALQCIS